MTRTALLLLHPGCEEIEAVTPADLLRRAGIEVTLAAVGPDLTVIGGRGIRLQAEALLADCLQGDYDLLVLPGGPGAQTLRLRADVRALVQRFDRQGRWIAAICAAPLVLLDAGIAAKHALTSFPDTENELRDVARVYSQDRVVVDGNLITARGAGVSEEFSLALIAALLGSEAAEEVRRRIVAR